MRSFSKLRAFCSFPDVIGDKPSKRRDDAAAIGTTFHKYIEMWVRSVREGKVFHCDGAVEPVKGWITMMRQRWTPPAGLITEVAMGLEDLPSPRYVDVLEPKPHEYVPADGKTPLLTAGRADLVWLGDGDPALARVCDIKTGQFYLGDPGSLRQVLAQGFASVSKLDTAGFIPGIYYARTGLFDWGRPVVKGTAAWDEAWRVVLEAAKRDTEPHPGAHCLGCWDKKACASYPGEVAA